MTELEELFAELGLSIYLNDFIEQGFDTWDTILDITESDFDALGVKLGHRRKLQRKIANSRGLSSDRALASPRTTLSDERQVEERPGGLKIDSKDGGVVAQGAKRKYRRHPKPDENAPERPPSAYVIFSNKMREELKGRNLSFTEIAKLVGENWQNIAPGEKEPYEQQAFSAKERYNAELGEYKKTSMYREYSQYLTEFKNRQANQQHAPDSEVTKRPKLEAHPSTTSSGTGSTTSLHDGPIGHGRVESSTSNNGQWESIAQPMSKLNSAHTVSKNQSSPVASSPTLLPGYRESMYGGTQQVIPWREGPRDDGNANQKFSRLPVTYDRRPSYNGTPTVDSLNSTGSMQHSHRTAQSHPPPLLTSESTNRSTTSSASSNFYTPRTPLELPLDRALPLPSMFPQKPGGADNQLPSLRPPSLSPRTTMLSSQQSPNSIQPMMDFPPSMAMAPIRGFTATTSQSMVGAERPDPRARDYGFSNSIEDNNNLDPVSALLKAGEIVNRNSRSRQGL